MSVTALHYTHIYQNFEVDKKQDKSEEKSDSRKIDLILSS